MTESLHARFDTMEKSERNAPGTTSTRTRSKRTREREMEVVANVASGVPVGQAAEMVGVNRSTLWRWRREDEQLDKALLMARATFLARQVERIDKAAEDDWKAASWLLERSEPGLFGRRVEVSVESEARAVVDPLTGMVIEPGMDLEALRLPQGTDAGDGDAD
jgi:hypothetical protein